MTPAAFGIIGGPPTREGTRALTLVAKVMQVGPCRAAAGAPMADNAHCATVTNDVQPVIRDVVWQNLANGVMFGLKEKYMEGLNAFIARNQVHVRKRLL